MQTATIQVPSGLAKASSNGAGRCQLNWSAQQQALQHAQSERWRDGSLASALATGGALAKTAGHSGTYGHKERSAPVICCQLLLLGPLSRCRGTLEGAALTRRGLQRCRFDRGCLLRRCADGVEPRSWRKDCERQRHHSRQRPPCLGPKHFERCRFSKGFATCAATGKADSKLGILPPSPSLRHQRPPGLRFVLDQPMRRPCARL
jgi:hypothetical protein